ncbi:hypothetical protein BDY24DRAFT_439197 [Mrakia frigida]|uniref:uncharacterized protein n=1 Tax=Mrakia frigida TaxID=29902 RepID=UPI003FCBF049
MSSSPILSSSSRPQVQRHRSSSRSISIPGLPQLSTHEGPATGHFEAFSTLELILVAGAFILVAAVAVAAGLTTIFDWKE